MARFPNASNVSVQLYAIIRERVLEANAELETSYSVFWDGVGRIFEIWDREKRILVGSFQHINLWLESIGF